MYKHGVTIVENPTSFQQPMQTLSAVQVVFGTAPINLVQEPAVNEPILARTFDDAKRRLGYSDSWEKYTLCEVMEASFKHFKVAPIVFINVLDPEVHKASLENIEVQVANKEAKIDHEGILLPTLVVKNASGDITYVNGTDYIADFDSDGKVIISVLADGSIGTAASLTVNFDHLDPNLVTNTDIIGGYDNATNQYKGIEVVQTVYPKLSVVPTLLLAPGFSQEPEVGAILITKTNKINGCFNAEAILDIEGKTKEEAIINKENNGFDDPHAFVCWPKAMLRGKTYRYSTIVAATIARKDAENEGVPFKSPSNTRIPLSAIVNDDGKEIYLDQVQANQLNAKGIITALNMNGWRVWGNNTAAFDAELPGVMDPKDRFIPLRRMFDWWGNTFILNYFERVDEPANYRLIESIVDSENIRANGFQAKGQIAGARIEFRQEDNPVHQILDGKIQFIQKVAFFTPAEEIINVLEFDPLMLTESLFGGE